MVAVEAPLPLALLSAAVKAEAPNGVLPLLLALAESGVGICAARAGSTSATVAAAGMAACGSMAPLTSLEGGRGVCGVARWRGRMPGAAGIEEDDEAARGFGVYDEDEAARMCCMSLSDGLLRTRICCPVVDAARSGRHAWRTRDRMVLDSYWERDG